MINIHWFDKWHVKIRTKNIMCSSSRYLILFQTNMNQKIKNKRRENSFLEGELKFWFEKIIENSK